MPGAIKPNSQKASWVPLNCACEARHFSTVFTYDGPTPGEIRFQYSLAKDYWREVRGCRSCGHFIEVHDLDDSALYNSDYVNTTYGDAEGLRRAFERINALPESKSDNMGRVARILDLASSFCPGDLSTGVAPAVLDVGSGLCVFLHQMKKQGWNCTALDLDARQAMHARDVAGVNALHGDFLQMDDIGCFDLITYNKVLEHVKDPVALLARALKFLHPRGFVYIEVPDGEAAVKHGREREEFLLGHVHVFSAASLALLISRAGLKLNRLERLREPSGKYTLWAAATSEMEYSA
jgi:2-polyprenyl-3-methyl-5-hydroxy-6-metoxy-1,4-benzoquinol methylase